MPTLDWIGKQAVVRHHAEVPFHLLKEEPELSCGGEAGAGNLIVQGDNLKALKALLPHYGGQVKCIYIDPPYNTGNEGWVYNDNVNSPEIKRWMESVVGKEGEDQTRHDKWLCMMYPRLMLLKRFLRDDGIIIVSIDDFEAHRLRFLLDEIFGEQNFIAQLVWDKTRKNDAKLFSVGHEYAIVYARSLQTLKALKTVWREQKPGAREIIVEWTRLKKIHGDDLASIQEDLRQWYSGLDKKHPSKKLSRYKWVDKFGPWRDRDISWPGGGGPRYDVIHPVTNKKCKVPERGWGFAKLEEMQRQIDAGLIVFRDDETQPPFRKAHLLPVSEELSDSNVDDDSENTDEEDAGLLVMPSLIQKQAQVSVKLQRKMFDGRKVFPNPKDHEVLMRLIRYTTGPDDIILDSFGGSGSTGHAVLQLNKEDGTNRRFILVEMMPEIAQEITRERIQRVVNGVGNLPPLGGGFRFAKLGKTLFDEAGAIREDVKFRELAEFVYFHHTGSPIPKGWKTSPLLGIVDGRAIYLLYNGILADRSVDGGNVLTAPILAALPPHSGPKTIYATACRIGPNRLMKEGIQFKQTPYALRVD